MRKKSELMKSSICAAVFAFAPIASATALVFVAGSHSVHAEAGGKGKGAGAAKKADITASKPAPGSRGALASELKGLNAAHASDMALLRASPNSRVGRIATYKAAAETTIAAKGELAEAEAALADLIASRTARPVADVLADIDALDPTAADYLDSLAALEAELEAAMLEDEAIVGAEEAVALAEATVEEAVVAEDAAFSTASDGRELSAEAMEYFRSLLELDEAEAAVESTVPAEDAG